MSPCSGLVDAALRRSSIKPLQVRVPRRRRSQSRLLHRNASAASSAQDAANKSSDGKQKAAKQQAKEEAETAAEADSPWAASHASVTVEGLDDADLLFRFGDTTGWEHVSETLGVISLGQAYQCHRKSNIIYRYPRKAGSVNFSYPLWEDPDDEFRVVNMSVYSDVEDDVEEDGPTFLEDPTFEAGSSSKRSGNGITINPPSRKAKHKTRAKAKQEAAASERLQHEAELAAAEAEAHLSDETDAGATIPDSNNGAGPSSSSPAGATSSERDLPAHGGVPQKQQQLSTAAEKKRRKKAAANAARSSQEAAVMQDTSPEEESGDLIGGHVGEVINSIGKRIFEGLDESPDESSDGPSDESPDGSPAVSSAARDATAEASTSGRESSAPKVGASSKKSKSSSKHADTVSSEAYLEGLQAAAPPSGQLVYQNGWVTREDDPAGEQSVKGAPGARAKGFGSPKDPPKAASKQLPKHLKEVPAAAKPAGPAAEGAETNSTAAGRKSEGAVGHLREQSDPAISQARIKQITAVTSMGMKGPMVLESVDIPAADTSTTGAAAKKALRKMGPLRRFRRRLRRGWKWATAPITSAVEATWLQVRYQTLKTIYTFLQPGPPAFHASPRVAQLMATAASAGSEAAIQMSKDLGYDDDGKHEDPLSDLPRWRLEALLGGPVKNMSLFRQALTAPSALPDGQELASYERLEYLGDSVLELAIREYLYSKFDMNSEGQLTLIAQRYLTSNAALCSIAERMHLERYMVTGLRYHLGFERGDELMLSDLLEALLGALFRDQGLAACQRFVRQQIINTTELDPGVRATPSRKSALISFVNTRNLGHISFKTKAIKKTLSNGTVVNTWNTEVRLNGRFLARADGTRKTCEFTAAKSALLQLKSEDDHTDDSEHSE